MKFGHKATLRTAVAMLLVSTSAAAMAQTPPAAQPAEPAAYQGGLQEIIVTAQKRSENLQNVPIAVTALTAATLDRNRVLSTRDLQFLTPSLVYNQAANNAQPFLRGIGSDLVGPNLDASVATYIDGVYVSNNSGTVTSLLGIDRVEVLEGPQGTLFGRNAVGGAISIYTLTPGKDLDAHVTGTYGNFNRTQFTGYISGPVSNTFSLGVYGGYDHRDTFFHDPNPENPGHELRVGGRVKAVWTPTETLKLTGSAEYSHMRGIEAGALRNIQPDALSYALGGTPNIGKNIYPGDASEYADYKNQAYTLREELDLGWSSLVGITAYRHLYGSNANDLDGTGFNLLADGGVNHSRQLSQELQVLSPSGSPVTWIAGLYFFRERTGYYPTAIISPIIFGPGIGASLTDAQVITKSYAAFGQATVPLDAVTEGMRLTLGGRYTRDEKAFSASGRFVDGTGLVGNEPQVGPTTVYPDSNAHWGKFTPKITLDYKTGRTLLYATYSRGFKGGAYNIASPADPGPVNPENLSAYEVGSKSQFAGGRFRFNTSAYYYKFNNLQVQLVDVTAGGTTRLQNAGAGEAYGFEGALTAAATHDLTLSGSVALEHTKYTDFPNAASEIIQPGGNASGSFNVNGNDIQRAPKFVFNLAADYTHKFDSGASIGASAKWYRNSGFFWEPTNRFRQNAYSLVNLSATYTLPGDHLSITGFVTNLTNKNYQTILLLTPVSIDVTDAEPRMYGVTVGWRL